MCLASKSGGCAQSGDLKISPLHLKCRRENPTRRPTKGGAGFKTCSPILRPRQSSRWLRKRTSSQGQEGGAQL